MRPILGFLGLVLNLIGTFIVSLSAKNVMTAIHTALMAHQTTLEAYLGGSKSIPVFTGLDETREKELKKSSRMVGIGLWTIIVGFLLQAVGFLPQLVDFLKTK